MKRNSIIVLLMFLAQIALSQDEPREIVTKFFNAYEKDGASMALDNLYATNKWMQRATDAFTNLKSQLNGLNEDYVGQYYGYELIGEKKLANSYMLLSYLVKFDRQPIRYTFQFYKPNDKWVIYSFKFDANIDDEIEESAKLHHLNAN